MPTRQRIVVCGAGVIGAAVAYFLTLRGRPPILVERARPGAAASGRAGGFLALDWNDTTPVGPLARASFRLHEQLAANLATDVGYRHIETLLVAGMDDGDVGGYRRLPNPMWLDGNVAVHSIIGTAASTAQVNPMALTQALVHEALTGGAQVITGVVDGLERAPGGAVGGVSVDGQPIPADVVVLALGPWMARAHEWIALPPIHALKGASITLAADVPPQAVFGHYRTRDGRHMSPEIYPRPGGEVYVNGYPERDPLPDDPDSIAPSAAACDELHRVAGAHSSLLADAQVTSRRACYRPVTDDGIPLIGPARSMPGVYVAAGHGAWGILNAPATGRMIAEMILDGRSHSVDAAPFALTRLSAG